MPAERRPASADFQRIRNANLVASISLIALIALCLAWELWLAPLRPGGSWLALKALPLLLPLFGILCGRRYTHQWASLLIQLYLLEGLTRATSDSGMMQKLAIVEVALALIFFVAVFSYVRLTARARIKAAD
ncbi:MAG: DUF2069 domain-containing protein [Rhodocyclaceae bacterium]|nr:DUF2069 domain-containing protein [Rhodocyclaceae bacterium]